MNHKKNWLIISISLIFIIYFFITTTPKTKIRKLVDSNAESLIRCADGPNYLISYYTKGGNPIFDTFINRDYVRPLIEIKKGGKKSDYIGYYIERLAINFIFFSLAIIIIIFWIIFSCCICNPKCCFIEKKGERCFTFISFIISIICLMGCLSCSISGFFFAHKYEYYLNGAICGFERIYYNIKDGQVKENGENWLGFSKISNALEEIYSLNLPPNDYNQFDFQIGEDDPIGNSDFKNKIIDIIQTGDSKAKEYITNITNEMKEKFNNYIKINKNLTKSLGEIKNEKDNLIVAKDSIKDVEKNIISYYNDIMKNYEYYRKVFKGIGFYSILVIYSILLVISFGCTLFLFLYFFFNSNKNFLLFNQIFWHLLIFFSIILFIYVGIFGMISMGVNDMMAYIKYVFGKENIKKDKIVIWKYYEFINSCLYSNKSLIEYYDIEYYNSSYSAYKFLKNSKTTINEAKIESIEKAKKETEGIINEKFNQLDKIFKKMKKEICDKIELIENKLNPIYSSVENTLSLKTNSLNLFYFMDCSFLKYDLEMSYIMAYDFQNKVNILFIITIVAAFCSIIGVIFMLITILRRKDKIYVIDDGDSEHSSNSIKENLNEKNKNLFIENGNNENDKNEI